MILPNIIRLCPLFFAILLASCVVDESTARHSQGKAVPRHPFLLPKAAQSTTVKILQGFDFSESSTSLQVRGGGRGDVATQEKNLEKNGRKRATSVAITASAVVILWLLWIHREGWMSLFNKEKLQEKTLEVLHSLNAFPKYQSYTLYTLGMALWEMGGLSTIPVETAAGMVFGWDGMFLSASGKLMGATLAFCLGRYGIFADWVHAKLSGNELLNLMKTSTETNPIQVCVLLKLSCFPETIKNYGAAILHPIKLWVFALATAVHGGTFSALWTYFGVDTAMRLEDPSYPADKRLAVLLTMALINGIVVSPLSMGVWIRNLKATAKQSKLQ